MARAAVYRKLNFNAAHRLFCEEWDDEKNMMVFGPCSHPNYHGHNYQLIVKVIGEIDPKTGFVIDLGVLKKMVEEKVVDRFDHRNLNLDVPEFKNVNPTVENIAKVIHDLIRKELDKDYDLSIRLYETPRNFADYPA